MRTRKRRFYRQRARDIRRWHQREIIECWCGARGSYEELFNDDCLSRTCGGTQELDCDCGGDICVCHHHGTAQCYGCRDCMDDEDDDFDDIDYPDDEDY